MLLNHISLQNFRNHFDLSFDLSDLVYISGRNGAGKSSAVEAIFLLLTLKTFRHQNLSEVRSFSKPYFRISADITGNDEYKNVVFFYQDKRILRADGVDLTDMAAYTDALPVVCYSPGFDTILSKDHSERRSFLDRMIFYTDRSQLGLVKNYNALLSRKRAELEKDRPNPELLQILNEQLAPISSKISENRAGLVDELNRAMHTETESLAKIFMPDMVLSFSANDVEQKKLADEVQKKRPLCGCHKDLLYIKQGGRILEKFQSFGQRKSALLFMLYHLAIRIEENRKCDIILLLDDFEAGLDEKRCEALSSLFLTQPQGIYRRQIVLTGITNRYVGNCLELVLE